MPIIARTAREAVGIFRDHLAKLVSETLTRRYPLQHAAGMDGRWLIEFREGKQGSTVPIKTRHGTLHLYLGQVVETVEENGQHRLQTLEYRYRIQNRAGYREPAVLRWEYGRQPSPSDSYNRHHAHAATSVTFGSSTVSLEDLHLPTGWVTIEEVIRFVIYELGAKPPCGEKWPEVLASSEQQFYELFTSKRYVPRKAPKGR